MNLLKSFYQREHAHLEKLSPDSKQLVKSIFLYNTIGPLFSIFLTAFLFRQTESLTLVALFNVLFYIGIPLGFYINGLLLKYYPPHILYSVGLATKGISMATLIFLPALTLATIVSFGLLYGITVGMYWANRNFLTLVTTTSNNRIYFSGLESLSKSITDVMTPFLIGILITFGTMIALYTPRDGYKILAIIMLLIVVRIGMTILRLRTSRQTVSLFITNASRQWANFRIYNTVLGFLTVGIMMLPPLMVLVLVGEEGALGIIQSLAALLSAFVVYGFSKTLHIRHRFKLLVVSIIISIAGALLFSLFYSALGVFLFIASVALALPFWWAYMSSMSYDLIDKEYSEITKRYAAVCDREVYINIGRVLTLVLFLGLIYFYSNDAALRYTPLAFVVFQILLFFIARSIEKKH